MKKIAIVLLAAITLTSCGGGAEKVETPAVDSCVVVPTETLAPVADSALVAVDTTTVK